MCYNIEYIERRVQKYIERYEGIPDRGVNSASLPGQLPLYYFVSGFSHPQLPVVKQDGIFLFEWGLIPSWVRDATAAGAMQSRLLNAVGETVFEKPAFRKSIVSRRCLLGVNGFYEWRDFGKKKYPYLIHATENEIFSLGCIYETWVDRLTGEVRNTFCIVTTPANSLMEKIHNLKKRMPLILKPEDEVRWVNPALPAADIKKLIRPFDESQMTAHTVSRNANSSKADRNMAEIIEPVSYPELD